MSVDAPRVSRSRCGRRVGKAAEGSQRRLGWTAWDSNTYAEEICWRSAAPQAMSAFGSLKCQSNGRNAGAFQNAARPFLARPLGSDFGRLGKRKRIINIDTEVSNRVFDLGVPKQNLDSSEIAGSLVDQGSFGAAERMCSVFLRTRPNRGNPFIY